MRLPILACLALLACLLTGCVSYGVASTAATVPEGERTAATLLEGTPAPEIGCRDGRDCRAGFVPMLSNEIRLGVDERSDFGVRFIGGTGIIATYKRRLTPDSSAVQVAVSGGGGMLNLFNTVAGEATLVVSAPDGRRVTPYGGLRGQQTLDVSGIGLQDEPTLGVFAGVRFGSAKLGISPEIGIHYDPSATGLRTSRVVVVPVVTVHGLELMNLLGRLWRF